MAVINAYVDADVEAGKKTIAAYISGAKTTTAIAIVTTAAADEDLSVYRLFRVPWNVICTELLVFNAAITAGDDFNIGLYEPTVDGVLGAAISAEAFADTLDLSSAVARGAAVDGLNNVLAADAQKPIYVIGGHTLATKKRSYDIAIASVTQGSGVGAITVIGTFVQA